MQAPATDSIGFLGLGAMGGAIARNLVDAGHHVVVYNRTAARAQPLVDAGATRASQPSGAAAGGIAFTMVADDAALEALVFGDAGIIAGLPPGGVHVSMSTIGVALSERLTRAHREAGQGFVSAPVFGRPEAAAAKKLFVVAAGAGADVARVAPYLDAIGQRTFVLGSEPRLANLLKLCGNFMISCVIESLAEAMTVGEKGGIDRAQMLDIFTSSLFAAPVYKTYGTMIAENRYAPAGFALPLGLKDNRLLLAAAEALEVSLPFASTVRDRFLVALASGYGELDWSAIAQTVADGAGIETRSR